MSMQFDTDSFEQVARVLSIVNPGAVSRQKADQDRFVEHMKSQTVKELSSPGYWGTYGYYIAVCNRADGNLYATAFVQAYSVEMYLHANGVSTKPTGDPV
jgi:hypothetical protein